MRIGSNISIAASAQRQRHQAGSTRRAGISGEQRLLQRPGSTFL